ncbi:hypothetical protein HanPSC8_Chr02g0082551 [Helianthus annuus]|nr:hypothetical protein HanPSC8_Chr02g0082551 [Helianthus annuus]
MGVVVCGRFRWVLLLNGDGLFSMQTIYIDNLYIERERSVLSLKTKNIYCTNIIKRRICPYVQCT